jgi:hypothetical protein
MKQINAKNIVSAQICKRYISLHYTWKPASKYLFFFTTKEGFYDIMDDFISEETILKDENKFIEDKFVYHKPHIDFKMTNDRTYTRYFETAEELDTFMQSPEMKDIPWVEV